MCAACCQSSYGDNSSTRAYMVVYCACQTLRVAGQRRWRRWLWQIALGVAILVVVGTVFSLGYNAVSRKSMAVPAGLTYVRTGDLRTRFRQWGTSGTPIVLVHGFIESADTWQYTAPRLAAAGHRVYALDLDGWGYSQRVAPFTAQHQTTQLLDFIAALHLHRPVLVGHSSGAAIVAMAALRRLGGGRRDVPRRRRAEHRRRREVPAHTVTHRPLPHHDPPPPAAVRRFRPQHIRSTCGDSCPPLDAHGIDQWRRPLQVAGAEAALWAMANQGVPGLPGGDPRPAGEDGPAQGGVFGAATLNLTRARRTPQPHALERRLRC